ncbi:ABC transporter permease [Neorhizobium sp. P12A]|uniref:ABC transporter permease n=1 Tax=Neorhizobium sp. P12A TaxID=2268027 RepID=UPI0011EFF02C|nr:ABC transporter permease [Neorhizobium sp. P12A]KAA0693360.1 ABC transporter permease [Neorhizobium sp. P12A]
MIGYILRRILQWIPMLLVSSVLMFAIVRAMPGDAADVIAGPDATPDVVAAIRSEYGLDRSLPVQYVAWISHFVQGDFGTSYIYHTDNAELIFSRIPCSLLIAATALVLAVLIGLPAGLYAGMHGGKIGDLVVSIATAAAIATPDFWFGIVAILVFAVALNWLPPGGFVSGFDDPIQFLLSLIMPSLTLALHGAAVLARFTRNAVIETLGEDYVRTARAKGIGPFQLLRRHILRNSLVPIVTILGILLGRMLGGAVVIESVFAWPGIGRLLIQSIANRDYGVVQAILVLLVFAFLVLNLVVDLIYGLLDPRIRVKGEAAE